MIRLAATAATAALLGLGASAQTQDISKNGTREANLVTSENFTGPVLLEPVYSNSDEFFGSAAMVTFPPGSRSNWHTHPGGQRIVVTSGKGWVQQEGEDREVIEPGDVVWCPPGVKHWHGATETTAVSHYAIQQFKDAETVVWMEPVTDEQYAGGSAE